MARHRKLIRKVRRRRSPQLARQELLDAAERLFRDLPPDQVGLKDIGREADVSHALVTHYFGTYVGVVEAVFERRTRALRERILEKLAQGGISDAETLIDMLFSAFDDPVHLRLMKWMVASEGRNASHALALRDRGLALVAAQVTHALDPNAGAELKERVELALVTTVAAAFGYAATKLSLASGLGQPMSVELDRGIRRTLAAMLQTYLRAPAPQP
ncbi:MAG TPA: TetR/AcrR family transcriptional regulator [Kofleriaceae bacterium]|nr:TetR/AcrR family transcriptional regulator [Kofleriaceae bacterium]